MPVYYHPPDETPNCQCQGNPMKAFFCEFGHMTECHYPLHCREAKCSHLASYENSFGENDDDYIPELGPCCACGKIGSGVRNIIMLHYRAPVPGTGWGCITCGLNANGAVAVLCDDCLLTHAEIKAVCHGYPGAGQRVAIKSLTEPFGHDLSKHP